MASEKPLAISRLQQLKNNMKIISTNIALSCGKYKGRFFEMFLWGVKAGTANTLLVGVCLYQTKMKCINTIIINKIIGRGFSISNML